MCSFGGRCTSRTDTRSDALTPSRIGHRALTHPLFGGNTRRRVDGAGRIFLRYPRAETRSSPGVEEDGWSVWMRAYHRAWPWSAGASTETATSSKPWRALPKFGLSGQDVRWAADPPSTGFRGKVRIGFRDHRPRTFGTRCTFVTHDGWCSSTAKSSRRRAHFHEAGDLRGARHVRGDELGGRCGFEAPSICRVSTIPPAVEPDHDSPEQRLTLEASNSAFSCTLGV